MRGGLGTRLASGFQTSSVVAIHFMSKFICAGNGIAQAGNQNTAFSRLTGTSVGLQVLHSTSSAIKTAFSGLSRTYTGLHEPHRTSTVVKTAFSHALLESAFHRFGGNFDSRTASSRRGGILCGGKTIPIRVTAAGRRKGMSAVGHSYGRRCMHGLLQAEGVRVCQQRVGDSLRRTFPFQHSIRRQNMHITVNPVPYRANYFGEKFHFDQNEKLGIRCVWIMVLNLY